MDSTVTVFVRLMPGAFPGSVEGGVRVYRGDIPANVMPDGWIRFNEVPVQVSAFDQGGEQ